MRVEPQPASHRRLDGDLDGGLEKLFFPLASAENRCSSFSHTHTPEDEVSLIARANLIHCAGGENRLSPC